MSTPALALLTVLPLLSSGADAAPWGEGEVRAFELAPVREFRLDMSLLTQPEEPPRAGEAAAEAPETPGESAEPDADRPGYGQAGTTWLTFGAAYANNFDKDHDINLHGAWSKFLADRLEFSVEAAAWYFDQEGENTVGLSGMLILRYHFWSGPQGDFDWSTFFEGGSGMLVGLDNVPDGGTGFNFIQRAGFGITKDLDSSDGPNHGARLLLGLRWHHISNGRINGDGRNPARDSLLAWAGVVIEF